MHQLLMIGNSHGLYNGFNELPTVKLVNGT